MSKFNEESSVLMGISKALAIALLGGTALTTGFVSPVYAQDATTTAQAASDDEQDDEQDEDAEETFIVTATGREESVSDVPYNISSTSGADIDAARTFDEAELLRSIPGVTTVDRGQRNAGTLNSVRMRGVSVDGGGLGDYAVSAVSSVSTYVNNTPVFAGFMLRDLDRVEVLRGPQGTLYGSGSLGGTIRYITRDPEFGETSGYASGSLSYVEGSESIGYAVDGVLNLPLGENAALRVVGSWVDYPGITDYVNVYQLDGSGIPVAPSGVLSPDALYRNAEDADTFGSWMGRATLLWEPTEDLSFRLVHARQSDEVGGRRQQTVGLDGYGSRYGDYENGSVQLEPSKRNLNMTSLEAEFDIGFATLTSSTSHYDHDGGSISENTGFYAQAGWLAFYYLYNRPMASAVRTYSDEAVVEELRLVSDRGEYFDYIIGGFYRSQQTQSSQSSYLRGFKNWWDAAYVGLEFLVTGDQDWAYRRTENFTELAFYGEATWHVSDRFDLTGGVRYFDNKSENDTFMDLPLWLGLFTPSNTSFETSESDVLFKINGAWWLSDQDMVYATISEGYRRGGTNAVPLTGTFAELPAWQTYSSDSVVNYEVGVKGDHGNFVFDLSAFYIDWQDPQLNTASSNWGFFAVQNGSEARTYGIEAAVEGWLNDNVHYSLGYAYVNAELSDDFHSPAAPPPAAPIALDGAQLPGTPEHQFNWEIDHTGTFNGLDTFVRLDGYYQSETRNGIGISPIFNVPLDGFMIWNATGTVTISDIDVSLWVKNIFNEEGVTGVYTEAYMGTLPAAGYYGNGSKNLISLPRTVGVTARYNF